MWYTETCHSIFMVYLVDATMIKRFLIQPQVAMLLNRAITKYYTSLKKCQNLLDWNWKNNAQTQFIEQINKPFVYILLMIVI